MNEVAVFRREHFNAAHRLFNPSWDQKQNEEVFGKCSNPNYHGHNYELEVKLVGKPDPQTGYVYDLKNSLNWSSQRSLKNSIIKT
jgi:6-pyruvoyltetrahydropterin/6-carboxytetrahydropterin synthase